jgi:hypothetical protein
MNTEVLFVLVCSVVVLIMGIYYMSRRNRVRAFLFGSLTGLAALFILERWGGSFNTVLPLNAFNVCGSAVLGVPFVIMLVIFKIL